MAYLPIGIQTFEKIRSKDYYYVDKTGYLARLADPGGYYFFARPRRFGKSVLVTTLQALFEGKRELFRGLEIENRYDWKARPVLHLDFAGMRCEGVAVGVGFDRDKRNIGEWQSREIP